VLGLTQFRIKRLLAYSTISHIGFILLALSINSPESIQSYIFYILQYSLSNLNAFIILVTIGFTFYLYIYKEKESQKELIDQNNSPVQLINQIKGYFHINPFIAISLSITLFSFVGVPPVIGFFAKQMVLSAALDNGYVFMALIAILTSVIGAGYYLNLVKQIFFYKQDYQKNPLLFPNNVKKGFFRNSFVSNSHLVGYILPNGEQNNSSYNVQKANQKV
jgi:NADH-ubiquinone oxidoreductase chain 2